MKKYIHLFLLGLSFILIGQGGSVFYHCYKSAQWATTKVVWGIFLSALGIIIFPFKIKLRGKLSVRINR